MLVSQQWAGGDGRIRFKISLDYTVNARPAWATCHPVSKSWRRRIGRGGENERRKEGKVEEERVGWGNKKRQEEEGVKGPLSAPISPPFPSSLFPGLMALPRLTLSPQATRAGPWHRAAPWCPEDLACPQPSSEYLVP